ncbi:hypothetical protein acdb102_44350 [Acidothermaceae bacterium B102]|nr:hypothetical protein acdb102_44350 [Acidothermaceae bacterium B102]
MASAIMAETDIGFLMAEGMVDCIAALTTPRSSSLLRELRKLRNDGAPDAALLEIAQRWGNGRGVRRFRDISQLVSAGVAQAASNAETLVQIGWAERGAELKCPRCGVPSFIPLADANGRVPCPGCSNVALLTSTALGLRICYRLSTFIDLASDQGTMPPLAGVAALSKADARTTVLAGVDIELAEGASEIDIFGVYSGRVVAGEVKTSAAAFDPDQIKRDVSLSAAVGADIHLMIAKQGLPRKAIAEASRKCKAQGLELLALSGRDLIST